MSAKCAMCQKEVNVDELVWIFTTIGSTEEQPEHQEEFGYCSDCKYLFELCQNTFHVIDGPSYTADCRPAFWHNDIPLYYKHYHVAHGQLSYLYNELPHINPERYAYFIEANPLDVKQLPFHDFPLIEDFEILLERITTKYTSGKEFTGDVFVWLFSPSRGYLTYILDHNNGQDLCQPDFVIPHGDFQTPYADLEQGWCVLMAEDKAFVYILAGNWEVEEGYHTWFKVEKNRYYRQWEWAIQRCRELDDNEHQILS